MKGTLDRRWWRWFEGYTIATDPSGDTVLSSQIPDQRSLIGALIALHELGYLLLSITLVSDAEKRLRETSLAIRSGRNTEASIRMRPGADPAHG